MGAKGSRECCSKQRIHCFSLAEWKNVSLPYFCWGLLSTQGSSAPPSGLQTLSIDEFSVDKFLTSSCSWPYYTLLYQYTTEYFSIILMMDIWVFNGPLWIMLWWAFLCVCPSVLLSEYKPRSDAAGLQGLYIFLLARYWQADLQRCCNNLHSHHKLSIISQWGWGREWITLSCWGNRSLIWKIKTFWMYKKHTQCAKINAGWI